MAYVTLDCGVYWHPKVLALGRDSLARDARGLFLGAIMYSRLHLTDGVIPEHVLGELDPMLSRERALKAVLMLSETGLLKRRKGRLSGWIVPDYAQHQQTKDEVETAREQAKLRKRRQRESRRDTLPGHGVTGTPVTLQEENRREEKENPRAVTALRTADVQAAVTNSLGVAEKGAA